MITAIMTTEIPGYGEGREEVEIIRGAGVTNGVTYFTVRAFGIDATFNVSVNRLSEFHSDVLDLLGLEG